MASQFDLLGVGSPLLDILVRVEEQFLDVVDGEKGGMRMVDAVEQRGLLDRLNSAETRLVPGGSAGNTVFALARLGVSCAMLGKLGKDEHGNFYRRRLVELGGSDAGFLETEEAPTGTCLSLITPDAERTMRSNLAASQLIRPEEVESVDFTRYSMVYIEGYMFYSSIMPTVMRRAKAAGCRIGLDLASFEVVRDFSEDLPRILREYVDIVLANEEEAAALFGAELSAEAQLERLSSWCEVAAIKLGRRGAMVQRGNEQVKVPAQLVERPVDTTAAGDLWAAGFLFGLLRGKALAESAWYGAVIAGEVVKIVGSEIPDPVWAELKWRLKLQQQ